MCYVRATIIWIKQNIAVRSTNSQNKLLIHSCSCAHIVCFLLPLQCRHFLGRLLLEFWQRAVLLEPFVVQELTHGDVGQLLCQLKSLVNVEEDGEQMFVDAGAHFDHIR